MKPNTLRTGSSLLERAAEIYDFSSGALIAPVAEPQPTVVPQPAPAPAPVVEAAQDPVEPAFKAAAAPRPVRRRVQAGVAAPVDRERLRRAGFVVPDSGTSAIAEELRLVKRQLLATAAEIGGDRSRIVLVCSAQADEGKTFCALNLALSLSGEPDREVLLVDADVMKPELPGLLGIEAGAGLVDALADIDADAEGFIVRTDIPGLSLLPAGRQANNVPELLASERTRDVLGALAAVDPRRLVIIDSPPALMASPAGILAAFVGQAMVVVRADKTTESELKESIGLLSACDHIGLVLNGAGFAASGRRFGHYNGYQP